MMQLLLNADLYAPEASGSAHLLIVGEKIAWIGTERPDLDTRLGVQVVDLHGRRVAPGLIDGHAHTTGGGGESGFASRVPPLPLSRYTRAGVTSVVGVLGTDDTTRDTVGLLAQTRALREEGISAWCHCGGYHVPPVTVTGSVRSDIVSLDPVIGVGELAISDHRSSQPTLDELLRIAADVHVAGLTTGKAGILHLHLGDGARGLDLVRQALHTSELPARVFNPTHVNRRKALFEEAVALAGQGSTVDVTAFPVASDEDAWSAEDAFVRYLDSGQPVANFTISSDGGGCLPHFNEQGELIEMDIGTPDALASAVRELCSGGVPLAQVLAPFTSNVAAILRLHHKGRLAPGMDADLIVLDEHAAVRDVMARGRWHVRDGQQSIAGFFESPEQRG